VYSDEEQQHHCFKNPRAAKRVFPRPSLGPAWGAERWISQGSQSQAAPTECCDATPTSIALRGIAITEHFNFELEPDSEFFLKLGSWAKLEYL
jgi:hypothetical protein